MLVPISLCLAVLLGKTAPAEPEIVVVDRADQPVHLIAEGRAGARILLDGSTAPGLRDAAMTELLMLPGTSVPEHAHAEAAELLYVLEGRATMTMGKKSLDVRPGMAIYIPKGAKHSLRLDGKIEPLRAIQVYTPGGPEQRFRKGPSVKE